MTADQILAFIAWLEKNDMVIAGNTFNRLLGTHYLTSLHPDDFKNLAEDAAKELAGN